MHYTGGRTEGGGGGGGVSESSNCMISNCILELGLQQIRLYEMENRKRT
jgi:hypothetical protein